MDFMKLLRSLDDFLYEVVSWIVFYPVTLLRTVLHPVAMLRYSDLELTEQEHEQYTDTFNPPVFLLITLFLVYLIGKVIQPATQAPLPGVLSTDADLLLFRGVIFSVFPMLMAVDLLRHQGKRLDRSALRGPFYGQCFIAAPFAIGASIAGQLFEFHTVPYIVLGVVLYCIAFVWYIAVEIIWFSSSLNISRMRATWNVLAVVVFTNILVIAAALAVTYLSRHRS
jgi:hypothetical protein